jgi:putative transposase
VITALGSSPKEERKMPRKRISEEKVIYAWLEVCRELGVSEQTLYNWKRKYKGVGVGELRRLKQLEEENTRLKGLVADLTLDKQILEVLAKKI